MKLSYCCDKHYSQIFNFANLCYTLINMKQEIWQKILSPNEEIKYSFTVGKRYQTLGLINRNYNRYYFSFIF